MNHHCIRTRTQTILKNNHKTGGKSSLVKHLVTGENIRCSQTQATSHALILAKVPINEQACTKL